MLESIKENFEDYEVDFKKNTESFKLDLYSYISILQNLCDENDLDLDQVVSKEVVQNHLATIQDLEDLLLDLEDLLRSIESNL